MFDHTRWVCVFALSALAGCAPAPGVSGGGVPPGATPVAMLPDRDPIGFLLQWRDTIGLDESTTLQMSRLNIRLFRRNTELQLRGDSILRANRIDRRNAAVNPNIIPDSIRAILIPMREQIATQTAAARDTARSWLTESQRARADTLEMRLRLLTPGPGPSFGTAPGRP